jgi:hypothetical protein
MKIFLRYFVKNDFKNNLFIYLYLIMHKEWDNVKHRIESRGCLCNHNGGRMTVGKVDLGCCKGTATSCKPPEFLFLLNLLQTKCEEIDYLRSQIDKLQNKPTTAYNDCNVNNECTLNNNCTVNNVEINGLSLLDKARKGENIYQAAYSQLQSCPPSKEKIQLLKWFSSTDPCDHFNFKLGIMNLLHEFIKKEFIKKDSHKISEIDFDNANKSIEAERENLRKQGLQLDIFIEEELVD